MHWSHVVGQNLLKKQLEYLLVSKQVPHALLFTGPSGYGGLPLALSFALELVNSEKRELQKMGLGEQCQHPDLHFIYPVVKKGNEKMVYAQDYAAEWIAFLNSAPYGDYIQWFDHIHVGNKQGVITVSEIELLHQKMYLKSFSGGAKVAVLWGAEKMNSHASNAFLKLLEEPPADTYFILVAEEEESLLPTVVSRCQQIRVGPIQKEALRETLGEEDTVQSSRILSLANGDYHGLQLLRAEDQESEYEALLVSGLRNAFMAKGNKSVVFDLINWSSALSALGREEQKAFLSFGVRFFRDAFLLNYSLQDLVHFDSKTDFDLTKLAPYIHNENIIDLIELFEKSQYHIQRNASPKILFSNLSLKLTRLLNKPVG